METNTQLWKKKLNLKQEPSAYQADIFEWVSTGRGNGFVEAVAGSGKTTTLVNIARLIKTEALFCAFNKHIAKEIGERLQYTTFTVSTIHGVGFRALKSIYKHTNVNAKKYREYVLAMVEEVQRYRTLFGVPVGADFQEMVGNRKFQDGVEDIIEKSRLNLLRITPENIMEFTEHYGIEIEELYEIRKEVISMVNKAIKKGFDNASVEIDFVDMIYLPNVIADLKIKAYPWVLIDEAQDLSKAQLGLVMKCVAKNGRMLFVGDRRQAIYGFAGADNGSVDSIVEKTNATILPLSICYRCPKSHIALAKEIVPQIEAAEWAEEGKITHLEYDGLSQHLKEGDIILCRITAPLVRLCYELIKDGVSAKVRGRKIGEGLIALVNKVTKPKGFKFENFAEALNTHEKNEVEKIMRRSGKNEDEAAVANLQDKYECVRILFEISGATTHKKLTDAIDSMFSEDRASVWLSTVHRAKGLEEDRVFILQQELLPFPAVKKDWQRVQEMNLRYIALTRAKKELFFVAGAIKGTKKDKKALPQPTSEAQVAPTPPTPATVPAVTPQPISEPANTKLSKREQEVLEWAKTNCLAPVTRKNLPDGYSSHLRKLDTMNIGIMKVKHDGEVAYIYQF